MLTSVNEGRRFDSLLNGKYQFWRAQGLFCLALARAGRESRQNWGIGSNCVKVFYIFPQNAGFSNR